MLDVGCGTGDLTRLAARYFPSAHVVGADFTAAMLRIADGRTRPESTAPRVGYLRANARRLPAAAGSFDVIMSAFVVRNLIDLPGVFREFRGVLRPHGTVLTLEITEPASPLIGHLFHSYFDHVVPWLGAAVHSAGPYRYLPNSLRGLPPRPEMVRMMQDAGFARVEARSQSMGIVTSYLAGCRVGRTGLGRPAGIMAPVASGGRRSSVPDPPFDAFRYAHEHRAEVAWLSQNTNHLVPSEVVQPAMIAAIRDRLYEGYPLAAGQIGLKELVLGDLGLPLDTPTIISAGATEALYMSIRALLHAGDVVLASDPSYLIIHKFIQLAGASIRDLDIYAPPYKLTAERLSEAVTPQTRMILLIDPLNPLGSGYSKDEVRAIAEVARDHRLLLLHDVTYRDFADHHTLAYGFYPERTLTAWSVSKNCGLAGLRFGRHGRSGRPHQRGASLQHQ